MDREVQRLETGEVQISCKCDAAIGHEHRAAAGEEREDVLGSEEVGEVGLTFQVFIVTGEVLTRRISHVGQVKGHAFVVVADARLVAESQEQRLKFILGHAILGYLLDGDVGFGRLAGQVHRVDCFLALFGSRAVEGEGRADNLLPWLQGDRPEFGFDGQLQVDLSAREQGGDEGVSGFSADQGREEPQLGFDIEGFFVEGFAPVFLGEEGEAHGPGSGDRVAVSVGEVPLVGKLGGRLSEGSGRGQEYGHGKQGEQNVLHTIPPLPVRPPWW